LNKKKAVERKTGRQRPRQEAKDPDEHQGLIKEGENLPPRADAMGTSYNPTRKCIKIT